MNAQPWHDMANRLGGENQSLGVCKELVRNLRNFNDSPRGVVVVSELVGPVHGVPRAPAGRREVTRAALCGRRPRTLHVAFGNLVVPRASTMVELESPPPLFSDWLFANLESSHLKFLWLI